MELGYPFHLTLVGDGPDLLSLQEHTSLLGLKNQVTFTGAVGQEAVHVWYNQANLFVLPSFAEGIPVVLMEAMSKTIACISTRITGIPELIEHGRSGLLCTPGDVEDLAGCMRILMDSLEYRRTLGLQARERVRSLYSLTTNCQNMASLFERHLVSKESI
jgi:glycosyltransferase involved in cell wall biosynthesis